MAPLVHQPFPSHISSSTTAPYTQCVYNLFLACSISHNIFCTLCGRRDLNPWPSPHMYPLLPLHLTLNLSIIHFCTLRGRWNSNPWQPSPRLARILLYHLTLNVFIIHFCFPKYYTEHKLIVWGPKRFHMNKLSTIKFHNFFISITFMLVIFPSEIVSKIWI